MKRYFLVSLALAFLFPVVSQAQKQYKLRQATSMMGMKSETIIYVKPMRKRTESQGMMGMGANLVSIEQCDLQRTVKLNTEKKLYFLEPFVKEDVIDEDSNPKAVQPAVIKNKNSTEKGGTIYMYYNITDTGERKKMYDFTARHVWTTQKIKPSADACSMKDSLLIKTDGWYIDLPQFNCPISYKPRATNPQQQASQPECKDQFVTRRSGKGKLGFPLQETTTIIMAGGKSETSEFKTDIETLELITGKLDSMLFEIPPGYTEVKTEAELQDAFDMKSVINQYKNQAQNNTDNEPVTNEEKPAGKIRVGVYVPKSDGQLQGPDLQTHLVNSIRSGNIEAVAVANEEEARKFNCDYSLSTEFIKVKQASKVGGLLKVIKNADPNAASSFTVENSFLLKSLGDGSVKLQQKLEGKYDGKVDEAAKKALNEESQLVLKTIN